MRIKRALFNIILFGSGLVIVHCVPNTDLESLFTDQPEKNVPVYYREGNFTNSNYYEYLVFYKDPREEDWLKEEPDLARMISQIRIFIVKDNAVFNIYDLGIRTSVYSDDELKIIQNNKLDFGEWDGFCYAGDYNGNGLDEIVIFILSGRNFEINIYEYQGDEFIEMLRFPDNLTSITDIQTEFRNDKMIIKVYGQGWQEEIPDGMRDWYEYAWSKEKNTYEVINKGIEEWIY